MKKNYLLLLAFSLPLAFTSCDKSDDGTGGGAEAPTTIAEELTSSVNAKVVTVGENRIQPATSGNSKADGISGDKIICPEGFTASAVAFPNEKVAIVSYQATDKSQYKGRLELAEFSDFSITRITSSLEVDGRINHVSTDGNNRIFVGLDTKKGPSLAVFMLKDDYNFDETLTNMSTMRVNGKSLNCIYYSVENGTEYLYSATGGNGISNINEQDSILSDFNKKPIKLADFIAKSGYQKVKVEGTVIKPVSYQANSNNRGKWVDGKGTKIACMHLSGPYGTGNFTHTNIQYYPEFVKSFSSRLIDQKIANGIQELNSKSMCRFGAYDDYFYVAAADKGLLCYSINETGKALVEVGNYAGSIYSLAFISANQMCVARGTDGIDILNYGNGSFTKEGNTINFSKEGNDDSANYVAVKNGVIFAAYGQGGIIAFPARI